MKWRVRIRGQKAIARSRRRAAFRHLTADRLDIDRNHHQLYSIYIQNYKLRLMQSKLHLLGMGRICSQMLMVDIFQLRMMCMTTYLTQIQFQLHTGNMQNFQM